MDESASFGYWVRRRRKALDLTQSDLARRVGCATVTIQKIEADERRPSREIAARLADHLGLAADERAAFIKAARAEISPDRLAAPVEHLPPLTTPGTHHSNLPAQPTPLLGREHEVAAVGALLRREDTRLVTLTGPGGVGKTRLGLQIAAELTNDFAHGVYAVDLAPIRDPQLVVSAIAATLGLREQGALPLLATLKAYLHNRQLLLLLDNFEQVLDAAPLIAELLAAAAALKVLVTSRAVLHLRGEKEIPVPSLALPERAALPPLGQLSQYAAVALFIQRARDAQPDFQVTNATAPAVAEICAQLDGLPLAIELAAARVKLVPPDALLARLSNQLTLLTGGARDLPARQQTMRATIAWSYDLLSDDVQALFRRLGVFIGGSTLDAAEAICGATDDQPFALLEGVTALVDQSLLRQVDGPDGTMRLAMLETVREYALERLKASGEAEQLRQRHARHYLALGEQTGHDDEISKQRMDAEYENMRSAMAWSQTAAGDAELALRLTTVMTHLHNHRGRRRESITDLERTLNHPLGLTSTVAHGHARMQLGLLLALTGNYAAAQLQYERALEIVRQLGHPRPQADVLGQLGWLAREQGDGATAWARLTESLALMRQFNNASEIAGMLNTLAGVAILEEDPTRADALLQESLAVGQGPPADPIYTAWTLNHRGHVAQLRGEYRRAMQLHQESLGLFPSDYHAGQLWAYHGLGEATLGDGQPDEAARWLAQGLRVAQVVSDLPGVAWCLAGLGSAAALAGQAERAGRLWGAAEQLRRQIGCRPAPAARATYERALAQARAQLGEAAFAAAWVAGQALTSEQAIAIGLTIDGRQ